MSNALIFTFIIFSLSLNVYSSEIKCQPWQVFVKEHVVHSHFKKDGTKVRKTIRKAHCREKWQYADIWGPKFKDNKPKYWPNKTEKFKKWTNNEMNNVLELMSEIPIINNYHVNQILRAKKSKDQGNPASNIPETKDITLYDLYFNSKNKKEILAHEVAHLITHQVEVKLLSVFAEKSGWSLQFEGGSFYEVPPKKLIKPDSSVGIKEDFL